jgi:nitrogen fixation/metabolism regulation signal transduction histidine kinase
MWIPRRRKLIVNAFQYRLLAYHAIYLFLTLVLLYAAAVITLMSDVQSEQLALAERSESARVLLHLHERVLPFLLPVALVLFCHAVLVSHRIAGPVHRFACVMRDIGRGDLSMTVKLRKKDYLWDEVAVLNEMIESLNRKIHRTLQAQHELEATCAHLGAALDREDLLAAQEHLGVLERRVEELRTSLETFRTRKPITTNLVGPGGQDTDAHVESAAGPIPSTEANART